MELTGSGECPVPGSSLLIVKDFLEQSHRYSFQKIQVPRKLSRNIPVIFPGDTSRRPSTGDFTELDISLFGSSQEDPQDPHTIMICILYGYYILLPDKIIFVIYFVFFFEHVAQECNVYEDFNFKI